MEGIPSWNDIGSIKLELDDGTCKNTSTEHRRSSRLSAKDIKKTAAWQSKSHPSPGGNL